MTDACTSKVLYTLRQISSVQKVNPFVKKDQFHKIIIIIILLVRDNKKYTTAPYSH